LSELVFDDRYPVNLIGICTFSVLLLIASIIDYDHLIIPNDIIIAGSTLGLVYTFLIGITSSLNHAITTLFGNLLAAIIGFFLIELTTYIISLIINKHAFGAGDSKYLFMIGSWLGIKGMFFTLLIAIYSGGLACLILLSLRKLKRSQKIPFAPFLSIGAYSVCTLGVDFWMQLINRIYALS